MSKVGVCDVSVVRQADWDFRAEIVSCPTLSTDGFTVDYHQCVVRVTNPEPFGDLLDEYVGVCHELCVSTEIGEGANHPIHAAGGPQAACIVFPREEPEGEAQLLAE